MSVKINVFLQELRDAGIYFTLSNYREGAVSVMIEVPGEHWEVDFLDDGTIDVERFVSNGEIRDESIFKDLFARFDERHFQSKKTAKAVKSAAKIPKRPTQVGTSSVKTASKV